MENHSSLIKKQIAGYLITFIALPFAGTSTALSQQVGNIQTQQSSSSVQDQSQEIMPGSDTIQSQSQGKKTDDQPAIHFQTQNQRTASETSQSSSEQLKNGATVPVGTAAAPYEKVSGVAVSRPVGVVIAPAKQRRARSFLIKVGVILGGAVAIGTVMALSSGSSSRPD